MGDRTDDEPDTPGDSEEDPAAESAELTGGGTDETPTPPSDDVQDGESRAEPTSPDEDEVVAPDVDATATPVDDGAQTTTDLTSDERTWGILVHAVAFSGIVVPFGNILGPLVVWLVKKDESAFVDANGKQALNFQLTWTGILVLAGLTIFVGIGVLLVPIVALAWLVLVVLATVRASDGQVYDYPLTIDLIT